MIESSESRGSGPSGHSSITEKKKSDENKPPFKLCFPRHQMSGRSDIRASKIDTDVVTPKFYSKEVNTDERINNNVTDTVKTALKKDGEKARDRYRWPLLSSQSYGWWYDRTFSINDPRFDHRKNTSEMVRTNAMIRWQDQKLRGLCH